MKQSTRKTLLIIWGIFALLNFYLNILFGNNFGIFFASVILGLWVLEFFLGDKESDYTQSTNQIMLYASGITTMLLIFSPFKILHYIGAFTTGLYIFFLIQCSKDNSQPTKPTNPTLSRPKHIGNQKSSRDEFIEKELDKTVETIPQIEKYRECERKGYNNYLDYERKKALVNKMIKKDVSMVEVEKKYGGFRQ